MVIKWYSHGLTEEKVKNLHKTYGIIKEADYRIFGFNENEMGVVYRLSINEGIDEGPLIIKDKEQIYKFLDATKSRSINDLEGKVVEVYFDGPDVICDKFKGFCSSEFFKDLKKLK